MDDGPVRYLLAFVLLMLGSGYFAGAEIALSSVNRMRITSSAEDGDIASKKVLYILDNFDKALTTMLIGTNVLHISIATLSTVFTYSLFSSADAMPSYAVTVCTLVTTVMVFLFAEMIPKCFAKTCNERFAKAISGSLIFLMKVLTPVSFIFSAISKLAGRPFRKRIAEQPTVTEDELYDIIGTYVEENDIDDDTGELVQNAIEFSSSPVRDVMTPWDKVIKLDYDASEQKNLEVIRESAHSRLPVINSAGEVLGTLRIQAFLKEYLKNGRADIKKHITKPEFVSESIPIDDLLPVLSEKRIHMAYIMNGDNIAGIITVEDIIEELVGEIYDEEDAIGGDSDD